MRILIFILLLFCLQAKAQYIYTKVITSNEGLLSNNVNKLFLDINETLWIGSNAGLAKKTINGYELEKSTLAHKFNNVYDIHQDVYGNMWVAGYGQGVLFFNDKESKVITETEGLSSNYVRFLFAINDKLYVGTLQGASIIDLKTHKITNPKFVKHIDHDFTVSSFFQIEDKIYATVLNDGIYEISGNEFHKIVKLNDVHLAHVFKGRLFVSTNQKLYEFNPITFEIVQTFDLTFVREFLEMNDQLYFVTSGLFESSGGLFQLENSKIIPMNATFNIPFTNLKTLQYDRLQKFLYIGTSNKGLIQINTNSPVQQITKNSTFCITNTIDKQYVFDEYGLTIFQKWHKTRTVSNINFKEFQKAHYKKYKDLAVRKNHFYEIDYSIPAEQIVYYQAQIHQSHIYVATNIGFFKLNLSGEIIGYVPVHVFNFEFFKNELITPVPYGGVRIFQDILSMKYSYYHDYQKSEIPSEIVSMAKTDNEVYFASALSGLFRYKDGEFTSLAKENLFGETKIKRIALTTNNELMVITDFNELYILNVDTNIPKISKKIPFDKIKGSTTEFIESNTEALFIGTNQGLNVFVNDLYYFIDKSQGLYSYNFESAKILDDLLYIASKDGLFVVNTHYFNNPSTSLKEVRLLKVMVDNKEIPIASTNNFELENTQNHLILFYDILQVKFPDKISIKYRLKNNLQWQDITQKERLNLSNLESGDYQIQFLITDEDSGKVQLSELVRFTIKPPFYLTWPFVAFVIIVFLSGAIIINKVRLKRLKKKQEIETKQLIYEKQLSDVKLQALKSQMNSHFLFNVLGSIQYFILTEDVDQALYYLNRFSSLIRLTLEFSDKKSVSLYDELSYLEKYIEIENLRKDEKVAFIQDIDLNISLTKIHIVPLLLQPFIENAMIHAFPNHINNPSITIKISEVEEGIKIVISDNGVGYSLKANKKHQSKGISIVQRRLDLTQKNLQKQMEINSSENGTTVILTIDGTNLQ